MTLTIFKNDDFKTVGFSLTWQVCCQDDLRIYHYGIQSGWKKEVALTPEKVDIVMDIMLREQKIRDYEQNRQDIFRVLMDNDWYKNQPVKMDKLVKAIELEENTIAHRLEQL